MGDFFLCFQLWYSAIMHETQQWMTCNHLSRMGVLPLESNGLYTLFWSNQWDLVFSVEVVFFNLISCSLCLFQNCLPKNKKKRLHVFMVKWMRYYIRMPVLAMGVFDFLQLEGQSGVYTTPRTIVALICARSIAFMCCCVESPCRSLVSDRCI